MMPSIILGIKGRSLKLTNTTPPEEVRALLGAPSQFWEDHTEHFLGYEMPTFDLELSWILGYKPGEPRLTLKDVFLWYKEAQPHFVDEMK
jgi:hypothetical protein